MQAVLIIWITFIAANRATAAIDHVEFPNMESCQVAAQQIRDADKQFEAICVARK